MTRWTQAKLDDYMLAFRRGSQPVLPPGDGTPEGCEADEGPESRLQSKIVAWCKEWNRPCVSFRKSTHAKGFLFPGIPDCIIAMPNGRTLWLELKVKGGRLSEDQKHFALSLMSLKHEWYEVRSFKRFMEVVTNEKT